jgi:hypothetical protein
LRELSLSGGNKGEIMKCPECGVNHRSRIKAEHCNSITQNIWAHYIILCYNMTGGVTEKNLATYKHLNLDNFKIDKEKKKDMDTYMASFKDVEEDDVNLFLREPIGWTRIILGRRYKQKKA